jgi:hypothetical protein
MNWIGVYTWNYRHLTLNRALTFCMQSLSNEYRIFIAIVIQSIPYSSLEGMFSIKRTPNVFLSLRHSPTLTDTHTLTVTGSCTTTILLSVSQNGELEVKLAWQIRKTPPNDKTTPSL